ncbi:15408_t:CDS:2 [Dentiscutata erythropus]|uniref:15408_t:CDS:1 n=1 Tax=Dentiscutata erythropus TaxID=1348616 RepID=A0A9N9K1P3_9GLOM|nr:15408_t:CDS:2 [Dentiscutata erythropus]
MKFSITFLFAIVFLFLYAHAAVIVSRGLKPKVAVQLQAEIPDGSVKLKWNKDEKKISPNSNATIGFRILDCDNEGCGLPILVNQVVKFGDGEFTLTKKLDLIKIHIAAIRGNTINGEAYGSITPIIANKTGKPEA